MTLKHLYHFARFDVPQFARTVAAAREQLLIRVHKFGARNVVAMIGNDPFLFAGVLLDGRFVECDLVVEASARHERARRRVGARHHPRRWHREPVLFVRRERIPYY